MRPARCLCGPRPPLSVSAEDVDRLIWDATCENNLVAFLPKYRGKKVGIMVKGCDSRAIVGLMQEGQVLRENLRIVGVSCPGVVDPRRVAPSVWPCRWMTSRKRASTGDQVVVGERSL